MSPVNKNSISMYDLLVCLTHAGDLVSPKLADHHQKVAYLSYRIANQLDLPKNEQKELMLAGLLHDVGALSLSERLDLIENEPPSAQDHASKGAALLENFQPLCNAANIIRHHHVPWKNGEGATERGRSVSLLSHILHLADRIAVQINPDENVIGQIPKIEEMIRQKRDTVFHPDAVDAFLTIGKQEYIWLDTVYQPLLFILPKIISFEEIELDLDGLIEIAQIISQIIDFRSPFTANHSAGVAKTAEKLSEYAGFSLTEQKMMLVAGYMHDFGKLAVKNEILEKTESLNEEEFNVIKSHTFYTFRLLQSIEGFETINSWASFHHEKLNGEGYPFHLTGSDLSLGSRIMAVADIFTAITEDRPYRKGMDLTTVISVLDNMVCSNYICPYIVSILKENISTINAVRIKAQCQAAEHYEYFIGKSSRVDCAKIIHTVQK